MTFTFPVFTSTGSYTPSMTLLLEPEESEAKEHCPIAQVPMQIERLEG